MPTSTNGTRQTWSSSGWSPHARQQSRALLAGRLGLERPEFKLRRHPSPCPATPPRRTARYRRARRPLCSSALTSAYGSIDVHVDASEVDVGCTSRELVPDVAYQVPDLRRGTAGGDRFEV